MDTNVSEALDLIDEAAAALFASDAAIRSVGVGSVGDGVGFIAVRNIHAVLPLSAVSHQQAVLSSWRGFPVQYQSSIYDPISLTLVPHSGPGSPGVGSLVPEQTQHRPLVCGLQIQNFEDDVRTGTIAKGLMYVGTLGCFVALQNTSIALLTNNHVAAGVNRGSRTVDRSLQPGGPVFSQQEHVAALSDFKQLIPSPPGAQPGLGNAIFNDIDAAVAELLPAQAWGQQYLPGRPALPPAGIAPPSIDDKVHKVGRTTALTWGEIKQLGVQVSVPYGIGSCWFRDSFIIEGVAGTTFANHGDSGSAIVRDSDGMLLGLLFAGNGSQTYACPIAPVMSAFHCTLA